MFFSRKSFKFPFDSFRTCVIVSLQLFQHPLEASLTAIDATPLRLIMDVHLLKKDLVLMISKKITHRIRATLIFLNFSKKVLFVVLLICGAFMCNERCTLYAQSQRHSPLQGFRTACF